MVFELVIFMSICQWVVQQLCYIFGLILFILLDGIFCRLQREGFGGEFILYDIKLVLNIYYVYIYC